MLAMLSFQYRSWQFLKVLKCIHHKGQRHDCPGSHLPPVCISASPSINSWQPCGAEAMEGSKTSRGQQGTTFSSTKVETFKASQNSQANAAFLSKGGKSECVKSARNGNQPPTHGRLLGLEAMWRNDFQFAIYFKIGILAREDNWKLHDHWSKRPRKLAWSSVFWFESGGGIFRLYFSLKWKKLNFLWCSFYSRHSLWAAFSCAIWVALSFLFLC